MDVQKKLDEIVATVQGARSMPMSASCVVNRAELLALLEEVREALPGSLAQAQELIGGREHMVEQARQEAERIIEAAHTERGSIVSDTQVARLSQEEADRILSEARREAEEVRAEADDYVDSKLANFEVVLNKTIGSVDRGREKLLGRGPGLDQNGYADEDAPEYSADPQTLIHRADEYVDAKLGAFEAVLSKTLEAVGRGRQKLHGRIATDALGEHMAAQEGLGGAVHTSDSDYLAGLAELSDPEPVQIPAQPQSQPQPDPYAAYQQAQQQPDPYAGYQQVQQQPDPYAYQQQAQHADPYGYQQQDPYAYQQPVQQQGHPQGHQQQGAALDETSFFDTGMIDLEQLRRYEQGQ
ncbi:cell division initiation protein [Streptomyces sp. NBC_00691]|uniref:cell division initiation protein n=1 Tax=Streptomyces sp. NBC_00691 TaxID=2903671 RepID=UPI002E3074FB|nr:cell division initiation protein [Streptomyces sp. NBC_00691]